MDFVAFRQTLLFAGAVRTTRPQVPPSRVAGRRVDQTVVASRPNGTDRKDAGRHTRGGTSLEVVNPQLSRYQAQTDGESVPVWREAHAGRRPIAAAALDRR